MVILLYALNFNRRNTNSVIQCSLFLMTAVVVVIHVAFLATPDDSGTKASTILVESWAFSIRNTTSANAIIFKRNTN